MKAERKTLRFGLTLAGIAAGTAILSQLGPTPWEPPAPPAPAAYPGYPSPSSGIGLPVAPTAADTRVVSTPSGGRVVILGRSPVAATSPAAAATAASGGTWAAVPGAGQGAAAARPPMRTRRS